MDLTKLLKESCTTPKYIIFFVKSKIYIFYLYKMQTKKLPERRAFLFLIELIVNCTASTGRADLEQLPEEGYDLVDKLH